MALDYHRLLKLYGHDKLSVGQVSKILGCSQSTINYWLNKYRIRKRSISEAIYLKHNPQGDPFLVWKISKPRDCFWFGLGLGLYWGEGTKSNESSIRLGNTDPALIKTFIQFLVHIYNIRLDRLKFGLQVFSDMSPNEALNFWSRRIGFSRGHFQKVVVTTSRGTGNYKRKIPHGVLTIYYNNKKLRDILCGQIEKLRGI